MTAAGAGAGSFSVLIGATARNLAPQRRAFASGFINAGGSFGQFVFAPLNQAMISLFGWVNALLAMAAITLSTLPLAWRLNSPPPGAQAAAGNDPGSTGPPLRWRDQPPRPLRNPTSARLHA